MSGLTYTNSNGENVFTSQFLKNRGTCCKTNCLHCPYGFTLKNHPLEFIELTIKDISRAQNLVNDNSAGDSSLSAGLLNSAFGGSNNSVKITKFNISDYQFVKIKDVVCGLLKKGKIQPAKFYVDSKFSAQGIDLDTIKSQYK
jgi:hypothetical protein